MVRRILIVEDNSSIRKMLARKLKKTGWEIHWAKNGKEGMEEAWKVKPDLIVMDMHMPIMSGHDAVRNLRKGGYEGLITALTASATQVDIDQATECGCNYFLPKPIDKHFTDHLEKMMAA